MRIAAITMVLMGAGVAHIQAEGVAADHRVTVCMGTEPYVALGVVPMAQMLASRMFAGIGVTIVWRRELHGCPAQGLLIRVSRDTPEILKPGALAYAMPYEGFQIHLFYDRIAQSRCQRQVSVVLAHVLVHEITHMLQGQVRHSDYGIMKRVWSPADFDNMALRPLEFAKEDVDLIYAGLAWRTARTALARSTTKRTGAEAGLPTP